jgi:hypothetical protein
MSDPFAARDRTRRASYTVGIALLMLSALIFLWLAMLPGLSCPETTTQVICEMW